MTDRSVSGAGFSPLSRHFAALVEDLAGRPCPDLRQAALLVSRAVEAGHVCLDLADPLGPFRGREGVVPELGELPTPGPWAETLAGTSVVGGPEAFTPLVLDRGRLYLQRYWAYEDRVARFVTERTRHWTEDLDEARLAGILARLFPGAGPDGQRVAAVAAAAQPFSVISGGPGTGKTSTVVKVLALLIELCPDDPLRIALAAPTGKAAARLMESIRAARDALPCSEEVRAAIPDEVATIHRLLGVIPGSPRFRHDGSNPLPHDVVVVDEASMVALPLMARLVDALAPDARLVLVGDHHQLASVEAGAVLGDLCGSERIHGFSPRFAALVARVTGGRPVGPVEEEGLPDAITVLEKNYRFGGGSGIGAVGRALWNDPAAALAVLTSGAFPDVGWTDAPAPAGLAEALEGALLDGYGPVAGAADPEEAHDAFSRFQLLCALRRGAYGVEGLNQLAERVLARAGCIAPRGRWYRGRPVLVTRNDYGVGLFNGDVGIAWPDPARGGELGVFFPAPDGALRSVAPGRLPHHHTAYAMTVHKSQGSEFDRVLLVLPGRDSQVLNRELLYTGLTRARTEARVWGRREVFSSAAARRTVRPSGLGEKVWGTKTACGCDTLPQKIPGDRSGEN